MIVIDASIAVKWFLDEAQSDLAAMLLQDHSGELAAPPLLQVEVVGALVRNANMVKSSRPNVERALARFAQFVMSGDIRIHAMTNDMFLEGASIAMDIGHPLKDCVYLTLAKELECPLITADERFAAKAKSVWDQVQILGRDS